MRDRYRFRRWIVEDYTWARMALPGAVVGLVSLPILSTAANWPLLLLSTLLPVSMIHQYEEHARGRFVAFFNETVGKGREVLTEVSAFWINVLGVWLLFVAALYGARYVAIGIGLVPVYLTVLNGISHLATGVALRRYNPGLYTSLLLFLPWGGFVLVDVNGMIDRRPLYNAMGLLVAVVGHAVVAGFFVRRRDRLIAAA